MNVSLKRTDSRLHKIIDVILISSLIKCLIKFSVTGETAISPAPTAPPAGRKSILICKSVETLVSVNKHNKKLQNCFEKVLKF